VDIDILKPNTGYLTVERPSKITSEQQSPGGFSPTHSYVEPVSEGEEDEEMDLAPAKDEDRRTGLPHADVAAAIAFREQSLKEREVPTGSSSSSTDVVSGERTPLLQVRHSSGKLSQSQAEQRVRPQAQRAVSIDPLAPSSAFDERLRERLQAKKHAPPRAQDGVMRETEEDAVGLDEENLREEERLLVRDWTAPSGKRIAVPVRVEPKVYFANERTFLVRPLLFHRWRYAQNVHQKWLNFAVLIGSIATTLLNFVPAGDTRGLISAALFTLAALLAIAYSAIIFVYRALRLRERSAEGLYYDKYGPTILCFVLLAALGTNIGLRMTEH